MSVTVPSMAQRLKRLEVRLAELIYWGDRAEVHLNRWTFNGKPIVRGQVWPEREGVVTLACDAVSVPAEWPLEQVWLELDLGGEGLVRLTYADGTEDSFGLDPYHQRFPLRGRNFIINAWVVARLPFGMPNRVPIVQKARLVWAEPSVLRLVRQLWLIVDAARSLNGHEVAEPLVDTAERALAVLDWPTDTANYLARIAHDITMLELWSMPENLNPHPEALSDEQRARVATATEGIEHDLLVLQERYPQQGRLAVTGQSHLDLAWLWPMEETRRKAQRTYHNMVGLLDHYPEFRFHQTSAQIYAFLEQDNPDLFSRIRDRAAAGRWETIGGMWVEPDCNMPTGESLVRQLLYGQRYFQRQFGSTHSVAWLPDCFGFSPALPQLLVGAGIENFFTIKLTWSETNPFPYDLFWWEGLDGSRVLAHMFDNSLSTVPGLGGYNGDPSPGAILGTWQKYRGKHLNPESLLSIGYGDGGGGVTAEMIEQTRELATFPALPSLRFGLVADFYRRAREALSGRNLPVWVGELYLELHRGTLTTQGRFKYLHRRTERNLIAAEVLGSMCALLGAENPVSLEPHWQVLLRNQFHDILPGSSIREVYQTAEAELSAVLRDAGSAVERFLYILAEKFASDAGRPGLLVVNPDLSARPLRLELDRDFPDAQPVEGGSVLTGSRQVPGLGAITVLQTSPEDGLQVSATQLENAFVRVTLAADGSLTSVYDKRENREALAGRGNQLWAYVDKPRAWDAWDVDVGYADVGEELTTPTRIEVVESGPHRAAIRVERRFRDSTVIQDIRLWSNSARLEFKTTLDWHDRRWLLKARFPLAIRSNHATFETAFGVIERLTHRNTSWDAARFEVVGHRFADLSEPDYGVALLNDGKYGHHAYGNELGLSLLRSPTYPDPLADEGIQTFTYALYPHRGDWLEGGVLMEAEDLNRPLLVHHRGVDEEKTWQALRIEGLQLGLGSLKVLEDGGGLVLRTYEPRGARGAVQVTLPPGWSLGPELNLLEEDQGEAALSFTPFQVHSWRLKST